MKVIPKPNLETKLMASTSRSQDVMHDTCDSFRNALHMLATTKPKIESSLEAAQMHQKGQKSPDEVGKVNEEVQEEEFNRESELEEGYELFGRLFQPNAPPDQWHGGAELASAVADSLDSTGTEKLCLSQTASETEKSNQPTRSVVIDFGVALERKLAKATSPVNDPGRRGPDDDFATTRANPRRTAHFDLQTGEQKMTSDSVVGNDAIATERTLDLVTPASRASSMTAEFAMLTSGLDTQMTNDPVRPYVQVGTFAAKQVEEFVRTSGNVGVGAETLEMKGQTVRLSLRPAELGTVDISISRRGKRLEVLIVPERESTGRMLRDDAQQLLQSLGVASAENSHIQVRIARDIGSPALSDNTDLFKNSGSSMNGEAFHDERSRHSQELSNGKWVVGLTDDGLQNDASLPSGALHKSDALYV